MIFFLLQNDTKKIKLKFTDKAETFRRKTLSDEEKMKTISFSFLINLW